MAQKYTTFRILVRTLTEMVKVKPEYRHSIEKRIEIYVSRRNEYMFPARIAGPAAINERQSIISHAEKPHQRSALSSGIIIQPPEGVFCDIKAKFRIALALLLRQQASRSIIKRMPRSKGNQRGVSII